MEYCRGKKTLEGTITAVSEIGVHFIITTNGGRRHHVGLSQIVQIIGADEE